MSKLNIRKFGLWKKLAKVYGARKAKHLVAIMPSWAILDCEDLAESFVWDETLQGHCYWSNIYLRCGGNFFE
ncbi:hypothetical protein IMD09_000936 [Vibrio parahaemolyticus]|uniref:hypothetical protein n=1 Tax=Vibrio parahaemolyticus TaxID=670 RepID=UPI001ECF12E3|nr:hypothetical protein [Vibrio parahaemolyticus]ELK3867049.1 hypothetical protein [Vibrio parahaemolyticus]